MDPCQRIATNPSKVFAPAPKAVESINILQAAVDSADISQTEAEPANILQTIFELDHTSNPASSPPLLTTAAGSSDISKTSVIVDSTSSPPLLTTAAGSSDISKTSVPVDSTPSPPLLTTAAESSDISKTSVLVDSTHTTPPSHSSPILLTTEVDISPNEPSEVAVTQPDISIGHSNPLDLIITKELFSSGCKLKNVLYIDTRQSATGTAAVVESNNLERSPISATIDQTRCTKLISPLPLKSVKPQCSYQYRKGPKKGTFCSNSCVKDCTTCSQHTVKEGTNPKSNKRAAEMEERVTLLESKYKLMKTELNSLKQLLKDQSSCVNLQVVRCVKLGCLESPNPYTVVKIDNDLACVRDSEGVMFKFKMPRCLKDEVDGGRRPDRMQYDARTKKHSWCEDDE